ncbi:MFS transporter [Amycolatopsis rhabdoformis]|uniref:MFS transporter n=1 Tax=Amycolatopsis rhabdoformis TaxID=1448059 RepID=A0ABZ1HXG2_9PSEU|nr:MFS transporter [Amycolatopsis rhabdoformis]WSE26817.1 MFS transporter [Amycolatopsis rhabdoformis]
MPAGGQAGAGEVPAWDLATVGGREAKPGVPSETHDRSQADQSTRGLVPTLVFLGFVVAVVSSLGAPLIPAVAAMHRVSLGDAQWSLTVTLVVGAMVTPVMGRLGDGPARRGVVLAGLGLVVLGCVLAALPFGFGALLVGRGLQGAGLGLTPLTIVTAREALAPARARPTMAILSITTVAGVGLGYPLTGLVTELGGLPAAYWFGAVVAAAALVAAVRVLPRAAVKRAKRLDVPGAVLLGLGLGALLLWISKGEEWGWVSGASIGTVVVAVAALVVWVWHEGRSDHPLVDLRLLRLPGVLAADVAALLSGMGMYLLTSLMVQFVQTPSGAGGLGGSVVAAGLVLLPFSIGSLLAGRIAQPVIQRGWGRALIPAVSVVGLLSVGVFGFVRHDYVVLTLVMAATGLAVGTVFAVLPGMITRGTPAHETGSAMSFNQVLRYVGYSTGSALSAAILVAHTPGGQHFPSALGYTVAAFAGVAVWVLAAVFGMLLPGKRTEGARE